MINTTFDCEKTYEVEFGQIKARMAGIAAQLEDPGEILLKGFQIGIEIEDLEIVEANDITDFNDPKHPWISPTVFNLQLFSGVKENFTDARMQTFETWNSETTTEQLTMKELLSLCQFYAGDDQDFPLVQEVQEIEGVSQLLRRHHEWLRDELNATVFSGCTRTLITGLNDFRGEIYITFSILTVEENAVMCKLILRALQREFEDAIRSDRYEYDLSELKENSYFTTWNIREYYNNLK